MAIRQAYSHEELKPKHHFLAHRDQEWKDDGMTRDTFVAERKHKGVSNEEWEDLQEEAESARELGLRWQERGPPAPSDGGPETWRGQKYRQGTQRWANRGGSSSTWWSAYYFHKGKGKGKLNAWLKDNPKPEKKKSKTEQQ
jgi:hypothetical protein